ncbi:CocE/NonD family hydrolase [Sinimarinibacterium thermocellulolyticum]|uniref:CocE/NonD family hydrolase n=1 Tax=Sinimarinibacterium thermocellulolyticum TaxID=3170016 RepID=A0ABV2A8N0_9GAMM
MGVELRPVRRAAVGLVCLLVASASTALGAVEPIASSGYLPLSDGTQLRYSLYLPPGEGPFPATLIYSGYNAGNNPYDISFGGIGPMLLERGIAVIGVSLRGTGCSQGVWVPFSLRWGPDGAEVVDWIARQPWSDGNVAMAGVSFPAILALATAVQRPPALRAVLPMVPLGELYRDVAYPGGIFNLTFASAWTLMQKVGTPFSLFEALQGDTRCGTAVLGQNDPRHITVVEAASIPYVDSDERYEKFLTPELIERIAVPVLGQVGWQDEQLGSRAWHAFERLDPSRTWMLGVNGAHGSIVHSARFRALAADFLEHFLRGGGPQDFDAPRLQIWKGFSTDHEPALIETYDQWPLVPQTLTLHAQPDGSLRPEPPTADAAFSYLYPLPAPSTLTLVLVPNPTQLTYLLPVLPGGSVALTTPALAEDLRMFGPASADLWLSAPALDVDVQVSLVEVRPDGREMFVQRGWLRASHRALDETRSQPRLPVHTHRQADARNLTPGEVTPLRVEIMPVAHTFAAGSSLRLYIEAPLGFSGFRQLALNPLPTQVSVHVGPQTPTRLVFGRAPAPKSTLRLTDALPGCGSVENQPCRSSPQAVPEGSLSLADTPSTGGRGGGAWTRWLLLFAPLLRRRCVQ